MVHKNKKSLILICAAAMVFAQPVFAYGENTKQKFNAPTKEKSTWELSKDICSYGTQLEMNNCIYYEYKKIDKKLNDLYSNLVSELKNPSGIKEAQRAWLKYRDAECSNAVFQLPEPNSLLPYSKSACLIKMTDERIKHLEWHLSQDCNGCPEFK